MPVGIIFKFMYTIYATLVIFSFDCEILGKPCTNLSDDELSSHTPRHTSPFSICLDLRPYLSLQLYCNALSVVLLSVSDCHGVSDMQS